MFRLGKNFFVEGPPPPVKGKIFDTRFGLIHVQTGKKLFCRGTPPPLKGKIFDTRFGLIHVQTGKKIFVEGPPPPPRNSKDLLWRCASCVHAGGLSCSILCLFLPNSGRILPGMTGRAELILQKKIAPVGNDRRTS